MDSRPPLCSEGGLFIVRSSEVERVDLVSMAWTTRLKKFVFCSLVGSNAVSLFAEASAAAGRIIWRRNINQTRMYPDIVRAISGTDRFLYVTSENGSTRKGFPAMPFLGQAARGTSESRPASPAADY